MYKNKSLEEEKTTKQTISIKKIKVKQKTILEKPTNQKEEKNKTNKSIKVINKETSSKKKPEKTLKLKK